MGITVTWDNEGDKQTIRYDVEGRWTWAEVGSALDTGKRLCESVDYPVNMIFYLKPGSRAPVGKAHEIRALFQIDEGRVRLIFTISNDLFIKALTQNIKNKYPSLGKKISVVPTLEAARENIAGSYAAHGSN
jgi:hypothetical protein